MLENENKDSIPGLTEPGVMTAEMFQQQLQAKQKSSGSTRRRC